MARWQPDASGRLGQAAMELYAERGFEQTTVAEIAARAGLTERTFFRWYSDKREVLFAGGQVLEAAMVTGVREAPADATPMQAVAAAVEAAGSEFFAQSFLPHSRARQAIIDSHASLQERELIKMATLSAALAAALKARGVAPGAAAITAEAGVLIFRVAFERWVADGNEVEFAALVREALDELRAATAT